MYWIIAVIVSVIAFAYWNGVKRYRLIADVPLSGPSPWPYIGNIPDAFKYGGMHKMLLAYFKRYGRVYKMYIGRSPAIVVNDPEMVKIITVKEFSKFPNRPPFIKAQPPLDSGLFLARDDDWRRIRATLTPTFSASKLKQIVPIIEKSCDELDKKMDKFAETGENVNCIRLFSLFALDVIMKAAFGYETNIQTDPDPTFIERAKDVFNTPIWIRAFTMFPFSDFFSKFVSVLNNADYFLNIARTMIESRQQIGHSVRRDLLQLMLEAHEEKIDGVVKLSADELAAQSLTFLLAGFETTGTTMSNTAYLLATHPDIQDKLMQELDKARENRGDLSLYEFVQKIEYLDQVLSEVLRLCAPAYNLLRGCNEEIVIKGVRFPKGVDVNIPTYCLHRDPEQWEKPEEFYPDHFTAEAKKKRHQYSYLPFGIGPRQCIGMRLAINEIKICLLTVFEKYKFQRVPETKDLEQIAVLLMKPKDDIILKIVKR